MNFSTINNNNNNNKISDSISSNSTQNESISNSNIFINFISESTNVTESVSEKNILNHLLNRYFSLEDYSNIKTEKDLFEHFFNLEENCLNILEKYSPKEKNFLINQFYILINREIFLKNKTIKNSEKIVEKIKKIKENFNDKVDIKQINEKIINEFLNLIKKEFKTNFIPKFLIYDEIEYLNNLKFVNKFKSENLENIFKKENDEIKISCEFLEDFIFDKNKPFSYFNDEIIKIILLELIYYSNYKIINYSEKCKKILYEKFDEIKFWFFNEKEIEKNNIKKEKIYNIENTMKNFLIDEYSKFINSKLHFLKKFIKNQTNPKNFLIHLISSYFYSIEFCLEKGKNNGNSLNNAIINNIYNNVLFSLNLMFEKENNFIIIDLENISYFLFSYVMIYNNLSKNEFYNKKYYFKNIKQIFQNIENKQLSERFEIISNKLTDFLVESETLIKKLLREGSNVIKKLLTKEENENKINYLQESIQLIPFSSIIYTNTLTILVSGFGSEEDDHNYSWKNLIGEAIKNNIFYFFQWPGETFFKIFIKSFDISQIIKGKFDSTLPQTFLTAKKKAKICGKILALILISKKFFPNFQINLIGFSLGTHVIKHCLKEFIDNNCEGNLINNVMFLAGATTIENKSKWHKYFNKIVSGRIINCHSKEDKILQYLYKLCVKKIPIGSYELICNNENNEGNRIENFDLSNLGIGHLDYRENLKTIMQKVNF